MDFWDPLFIDTLAAVRPVIVFDQAGVGRSTGTIPTTFQGWANDLIALMDALDITKIDLFGFSMGGMAVQMVALTRPDLVRRLILAGTSASRPLNELPGVVWPRELPPTEPLERLSTAISTEEGKHAIAYSFFPDNDVGRSNANEYWKRISRREAEPPNLTLLDREAGARRQRMASLTKDQSDADSWFNRLKDLKMPVLIANGDDDTLIPTSRSWELLKQIENAQLIIYPRAGHGFLWQYARQFAEDINNFLSRNSGDIS